MERKVVTDVTYSQEQHKEDEERVRGQSRSSSRWMGPRHFRWRCHQAGDMLSRIPSGHDSKHDMYAVCEGRVIRRDDELKGCGVRDRSTTQVVRRMRSGGKHKEKKSKAEKKQVASLEWREQKSAEESRSGKGPATQGSEGSWEILESVVEGSDSEVEHKMRCLLESVCEEAKVSQWTKA